MSTISDWTGKAMHGRQQGWAKVTVRMTGTGQPTSLGSHRVAPMSAEDVAIVGRSQADACRPGLVQAADPASDAAPMNRKTPFQPSLSPPGGAGAAVFHFQTGCLQP